jgi:acyl-CoA thioesterase-1
MIVAPNAGIRQIVPVEDACMPDALRPCDTHPDLVDFSYPLPHLTRSLKRQLRTRIVAIGSSSTAGADQVIPFPPRLELALRSRLYGRTIDVINRGIGGQEAADELSRFQSDVIEEAPSLVIWQVGTNAVYRDQDYDRAQVAEAIAAGLDVLADLPMDVVLMDLQYTRAITGPDKLGSSLDMVSRISAAAEKANVNVFRRFALMQRWVQDKIPIEELDDGGQLHTSEWATACVSQVLFDTIVGAPPDARDRCSGDR